MKSKKIEKKNKNLGIKKEKYTIIYKPILII